MGLSNTEIKSNILKFLALSKTEIMFLDIKRGLHIELDYSEWKSLLNQLIREKLINYRSGCGFNIYDYDYYKITVEGLKSLEVPDIIP